MEENDTISDVQMDVRDIKMIVKDVNAKLTFALICVTSIIVLITMK